MNLRGALLALSLTLAAQSACAAGPGQAEVEKALAADSRADRIAALERALAAAGKKEADLIALHLAEQRRLNGDASGAESGFKAIKKGDIGRAADLGVALAALAQGKDRMSVLLEVSPKVALPTQNADRYAMLAMDHQARGELDMARQLKNMALDYAKDDAAVKTRLEGALAKVGQEGGSTPAVAATTEGVPSGDPRIDKLDAAVAAGNRAKVQSLASEIAASAEAGSDAALIAKYAERRIGLTPDARTIAVLLPMSGKYRGVGNVLKGALELGYGSGGGGRKLVFVDTGADGSSAKAALERAIFDMKAIAVVGPVRSDLADDLAQIAQATRTPLLGLHQSGTASLDRPWSIDGVATARVQVEGLVSHLMLVEDMKAFAIFAPDSPYGRAAAQVFEAEVKERGGSITVKEFYDNSATDLIPFAKKLGRKDYKARASEWYQVKKDIEQAGGDPSRAVLPPIIDFDAIFMPDKSRRIPVAAAGLAYEEFPIGDFRIKKTGPTIPLVGLSGWNNAELVTTGGPYVRNSRFVDVFLPESSSAAAFVERYRADAGKAPNTLEAQVYTVGQVLRAAARSDARTRTDFRQALIDSDTGESTATGADGVHPEAGWVNHRVRILTLDKNGIREVKSPAAQDPE